MAMQQPMQQPRMPGGPGDPMMTPFQGAPIGGPQRMDDRSTANKAASSMNKTAGKVADRTKVILVKATGDGVQKVRPGPAGVSSQRALRTLGHGACLA